MKRVFIIHGLAADPNCNWFPWLKKELEQKGYAVFAPYMPSSRHPICGEWIEHLKTVIGDVDNNTILVGHSLGGAAILRFLEKLEKGKFVAKVFIIAGPDDNPGFPELNSFTYPPADFERIKGASDKGFVLFHSDDDPVVPFLMGQRLAKKLEAEFIALSGFGHLNAGIGDFTFPVLLDKILEIN
jgi:predicted alpha/beta hydrolase family esterase